MKEKVVKETSFNNANSARKEKIMKFVIEKKNPDRIEQVADAIEFLKKAFKEGKLKEIENFDDLIEALDSTQDLEYLCTLLEQNHINI